MYESVPDRTKPSESGQLKKYQNRNVSYILMRELIPILEFILSLSLRFEVFKGFLPLAPYSLMISILH